MVETGIEALKSRLKENFKAVEDRICEACERAGRSRSDITLIAVTKAVDANAVIAAHLLGQLDFGENYVQPARSKIEEVRKLNTAGARFHMIGHLQRNKVRSALTVFESLHSLDSFRLLKALEKELAGTGRKFPCFIEVNVGGEESKYGLAPDKVSGLVEAVAESTTVEVAGLMTMAPYMADTEDTRPVFARLRKLKNSINEKRGKEELEYLSMGMTNDFEVAVEEGATHLRIGTALFRI